jgi:signal transduction histidine kinase
MLPTSCGNTREVKPGRRLAWINCNQKQVCAMHNPNAHDHDAHQSGIEPRVELPDTLTVDTAHEFRELLTIALFSLKQLQRQSLDDRGREQLQRADRAVDQIGEIINRIQPI